MIKYLTSHPITVCFVGISSVYAYMVLIEEAFSDVVVFAINTLLFVIAGDLCLQQLMRRHPRITGFITRLSEPYGEPLWVPLTRIVLGVLTFLPLMNMLHLPHVVGVWLLFIHVGVAMCGVEVSVYRTPNPRVAHVFAWVVKLGILGITALSLIYQASWNTTPIALLPLMLLYDPYAFSQDASRTYKLSSFEVLKIYTLLLIGVFMLPIT